MAYLVTGGMGYVMTTMQEVRDMVVNAINFSKPTVCALNGTSVGGPFAFAMLNDFVIAERHVVFSDLHVPPPPELAPCTPTPADCP